MYKQYRSDKPSNSGTYTQRAKDLCVNNQQTKLTDMFVQRLDLLVDPVHIKLATAQIKDTPTHYSHFTCSNHAVSNNGIYPDQDNESSNS